MREIEIKARVKNAVKLREVISSNGVKLSDPLVQHDVVFCLPGSIENRVGAVWMRIRTENNTKHILTLKKSVNGSLDNLEHETVIENTVEMKNILLEMGYELYSDIEKTRQKAKVDDIELCIDRIDHLGDFIEAEMMCDSDDDGDAVRAKLWSYFESIGVGQGDEVTKGYDELDREFRGLNDG